jgi:hypothetical protein
MRWFFILVFLLTPLLAAAHEPENEIKFVEAWDSSIILKVLVTNTEFREEEMSCVGFNADGMPLFQRQWQSFHFATEFHLALNERFSATDIADVKCDYID